MTLFLSEPEYVFGCLGFLTAKPVRRSVIWVGALLSGLTVILGPLLLLFRHTTPPIVGQTMFAVICAWLFVFGAFRLFVTFAMWLFDKFGELITDAIPGLTAPVNFAYRGYWMVFEVFHGLGFLGFLLSALLLLFGLVEPLF
jgi:hypothetical protein